MNNCDDEDIGFSPDIHSSTDSYAERFEGAAGIWLLSRQQQITKSYLEHTKPKRVLDVGGGHAQNIEVLEGLGIDLLITGSAESCNDRVKKASRSNSTQFILGDLSKLPVTNNEYPVVISYRIISHLQNWQKFIAELCRVSNNAVIIDFATKRSVNWFSELAYTLKRGNEGDTRKFNVFSESTINAEFKKNGYSLTKRTPQFFFPMAIHRALKSPTISNTIEKISQLLGLSYLFGSPVISKFQRVKK